MNKSKVLLPMSLVILAAAIVCVLAAQDVTRANSSDIQAPNWRRVDQAARNVKTGDETAVRALVKEVFADDGIGENIVATAGSVPDRLVAAEIAYQKGKLNGVSEESVVNAVNQLAQRFNAPEYAYTSLAELRKLRLRMLTIYPGFIGRGPAATRDDSKPRFEHNMSPVEAFHVTATLIFQKIANPEFQVPEQEIESARQGKPDLPNLTLRVTNGERSNEILGVIRQAAAAMSLRDILNQSEQALDQLGIPR